MKVNNLKEYTSQYPEDYKCLYCGGNCPKEPEDSGNLCDGFAGDIDNLYNTEDE